MIINKYDEFIITTKLQEEYLSHMMSIKQLANVKKDDLMNVLHNFRKIPSIKNEVIQFLDLANRSLASCKPKVKSLSYVDAEGLYLVKKNIADIFITDDISCWIVAEQNNIRYSSSILEIYHLLSDEKINFMSVIEYLSKLFNSAGWQPIRGYHAEIAMKKYFEIVTEAVILSKDKIKSKIIRSAEDTLSKRNFIDLVNKIFGCE